MTARAGAERDETLRFLDDAADNMTLVLWVYDAKTRALLYVSRAYETLWGRPRETLRGDPLAWLLAVVPEDRERVRAAVLSPAFGTGLDIRYRIERPDASQRWIRCRTFPIRDPDGEVRRVSRIAEDVTDVVSLEQALAARARQQAAVAALGQRALVETDLRALEEEALRTLADTLGLDCATLFEVLPGGQELRIVAGRGYDEGVVGSTVPADASPAGYSVRTMAPVCFDDMSRERRFAGTQIMRDHGIQSGVNAPIICKAGPYGSVAALSTKRRSYTEDDVHYVLAIANVLAAAIDRQRDAEALRRSEERFRQSQKMEAIGRLAGGVAHDFNNLLTAILGYSELGLEGLAPEAPLERNLREIRKAAQRAQSLTRQLLSFSRRRPLSSRTLDLTATVADMLPMLRRLIGEDMEVVFDRSPSPTFVRADAGQLEQVVLNLVVNARDAMPAGGRLTIQTSLVEPGGVCLAIADAGEGMDEATRTHLFEPFFTTKAQGKGTGLGLSTVYGIVQQCGGTIDVASAPGKGTRFQILLPRVAEGAAVATDATAAVRGGSETVLLVEDEEMVRALAALVLRSKGYAVLEAGDGIEARHVAAATERIDLVVTDVVMPRMGGVELVKHLRVSRPRTRILLVSGYTGGSPTGDEVLDASAAFLEKPFSPEALLRRVRELLDAPEPAPLG